MFQGLRELSAAKGRTALIVITVGMITVMVTFLSSLAAGLSYQSVSALQQRLGSDQALVLQSGEATTIASSNLNDADIATVKNAGGSELLTARDQIGTDTVVLMSDPTVPAGTIAVPPALLDGARDHYASERVAVEQATPAVFLDHQPVLRASEDVVAAMPGARAAGVLPAADAAKLDGQADLRVLTGADRWGASASYKGEQTSLSMMIVLLYLISGLVLGAFFMVWTMQRLRGVAVSAALGASRRVLVADCVGQALVVLALGITGGVLITLVAGSFASQAVPVSLTSSSLLQPAAILAACGLLGAALSIRPIMRVSPRSALATA